MDGRADYYGALGVLPTADQDVIKAAYRALAKKYHPDAGTFGKEEAEKKFNKLNEAFQALSDPSLRKQYDEKRKRANQRGGQFDSDAEVNTEDVFSPQANKNWALATKYYPEAVAEYERLAKVSRSLAMAYRMGLLATQRYENAEEISTGLLEEFGDRYFGDNVLLQKFGLWCLANDRIAAARELNQTVNALGPSAEAEPIVDHLSEKYGIFWLDHSSFDI